MASPGNLKREEAARGSAVAVPMAVLVSATLFGLCFLLTHLDPIRFLSGPYATSDVRIVKKARCPDPGPDLHHPEPKTFDRGECACTPVRYFAILSMQRSGSGWFETFLNSHGNISSNGEIFSVKERRSNASSVLRTLDRVYDLDWFSSAAKNECLAAVGFKWMLNQGVLKFHDEIVEYFNRRGVSAIFLLRRNLLQRMISILANTYDQTMKQLNGTHKSHVHSEKEAQILAKFKPTINASLLLRDLKQAENMAASGLEYFKSTRHIILYYEDLVNNRTKLIDVQDFLGVPRQQLVSRQVKIHKKPLPEQISNWKEVHDVLKGTKYEIFCEDKLVRRRLYFASSSRWAPERRKHLL